MFDKFLNFCHRLTLTKQYCVVSAKFTQLNPFLHLFNRSALNYCPVFEFFSAPLFTPPALLNRVPFGCSSGVGPEDRTGALSRFKQFNSEGQRSVFNRGSKTKLRQDQQDSHDLFHLRWIALQYSIALVFNCFALQSTINNLQSQACSKNIHKLNSHPTTKLSYK